MNRTVLFLLAMGGFVSAWIVSNFQNSPGYMDADYYYAGGLRLAEGHGFNELILWNYLDDPTDLPHPSHAYWMPLPSIVAAIGLVASQRTDFFAARLGFLLLTAWIAPLTAAVAWKLTRQRETSIFAGCLAILPVFYLPYLPTSDSFGLCMLLGGFFFLLVVNGSPREKTHGLPVFNALGLGMLSGGMHLCRAEGFIWLLAGLLAIWLQRPEKTNPRKNSKLLLLVFLCVLGYLLVMGPWILRNLSVFGTPLAPKSQRAMWISEYNELYSYPAGQISFDHWKQSGWESIIRARLWAAGQNFQTALAVQGEIYLLPFILVGMWRLRRDIRIQIAAFIWVLLFLLMTLVFPFQGARGGFFHAGAGLQPLFWAAALVGFYNVLEWGARKRNWNLSQAKNVFTAGMLGLALLLTFIVSTDRLDSSPDGQKNWDAPNERYTQIAVFLNSLSKDTDEVVMVGNAPGFFIASGRPSISIPHAELAGLCAAAQRYHAQYLLLEMDQILGREGLYENPNSPACLNYLITKADTRIFKISGQ